MTITFYLKEESEIEEESASITIVRKGKDKKRSQSINAKKLDDLTATEQQTMRAVFSIIEKYRGDQGAKELTYGL
jgi:hypothetical protein